MNVLTDEEIDAVAEAHPYNISLYTRAIEAAVIRKLAAGVSVEPVAEVRTLHYGDEHPPVAFTGVVLSDKTDYYSLPFRENTPLYTATALAAARVQENERCAKFSADFSGMETARAIRALLGKEAQS